MLTLAVDTTAEFGSIALLDDTVILEEILLHETNGFSASLFGQIEALLQRREIELGQIDLFAGASGPGSFTGVRVGLAAIKGLAEVLNKPAAAVSNLEALASFGTAPKRATVIDARRGEVYAALYEEGGHAIIEETVIRFPALLTLLNDHEFEWVSADFAPFASAISGTRFEHMPSKTAPRALAGAMGRLAMKRLKAGLLCDPTAIEANYVRRSDAELLWKTL